MSLNNSRYFFFLGNLCFCWSQLCFLKHLKSSSVSGFGCMGYRTCSLVVPESSKRAGQQAQSLETRQWCHLFHILLIKASHKFSWESGRGKIGPHLGREGYYKVTLQREPNNCSHLCNLSKQPTHPSLLPWKMLLKVSGYLPLKRIWSHEPNPLL